MIFFNNISEIETYINDNGLKRINTDTMLHEGRTYTRYQTSRNFSFLGRCWQALCAAFYYLFKCTAWGVRNLKDADWNKPNKVQLLCPLPASVPLACSVSAVKEKVSKGQDAKEGRELSQRLMGEKTDEVDKRGIDVKYYLEGGELRMMTIDMGPTEKISSLISKIVTCYAEYSKKYSELEKSDPETFRKYEKTLRAQMKERLTVGDVVLIFAGQMLNPESSIAEYPFQEGQVQLLRKAMINEEMEKKLKNRFSIAEVEKLTLVLVTGNSVIDRIARGKASAESAQSDLESLTPITKNMREWEDRLGVDSREFYGLQYRMTAIRLLLEDQVFRITITLALQAFTSTSSTRNAQPFTPVLANLIVEYLDSEARALPHANF